MTAKCRIKAGLLGVAAAGLVAAWSVGAQDGGRTIRDGVFSAPQAARGERVFGSICMNCHEISEFTGADAYLAEVEGESLWDTFDYIWSAMPEDDPGSSHPKNTPRCLRIFSVSTVCRAATPICP